MAIIRLLALCGAHFRLSVEKSDQKLLKTLEVCKAHNAELDIGKIVTFDMKPGFGVQICPMDRATIKDLPVEKPSQNGGSTSLSLRQAQCRL